MRVPITNSCAFELERWLGRPRFQRLGLLTQVYAWRPPSYEAPEWLLMLGTHRAELLRAAVERLCASTAVDAPVASEAVTRAQRATLELVDQADEDPDLAACVEGVLRLQGGGALFHLIKYACRRPTTQADRQAYRHPPQGLQ